MVISFTMKTERENGLIFTWNTSKAGIYDDSGNKYAWSLNMPGLQENGRVKLPGKTPVAGKITVKKVPTSVSELHTVLLPLFVNFYGHNFAFEVRMSNLKVGQKPATTVGISTLFGKNNETEPVAISRKFLTAMVNGDVKAMLSYDIDYTKADAAGKAKQEGEYDELLKKMKGATFTIGQQKADPNGHYFALVDVVVTMKDGSAQNFSIPFVKENGKLYIQMSS